MVFNINKGDYLGMIIPSNSAVYLIGQLCDIHRIKLHVVSEKALVRYRLLRNIPRRVTLIETPSVNIQAPKIKYQTRKLRLYLLGLVAGGDGK